MDPDLIQAITYVAVAIVIGAYVAFVIWRVRVDRAKKAAAAAGGTPAARAAAPRGRVGRAERKAAAIAGTTPVNRADMADAEWRVLAAAARLAGKEPPPPPTAAGTATATGVGAAPAAAAPSLFVPAPPRSASAGSASGVATVAELLAGIRLPTDLAPITTLAPRAGVRDRVAFVTVGAPAEAVAPAFAAELERLGFTIQPEGYDGLVVTRGDDRGKVLVHPSGTDAVVDGVPAFPTAPERSVVVEVWIPSHD